jgi:hypothetical protein
MDHIFLASGSVETLKALAADLPDGFKPLASRRGEGMADQLREHDFAVAIIRPPLQDRAEAALLDDLRELPNPPGILWLGDDAPADIDTALDYPVPGPVFRRAVQKLRDRHTGDAGPDVERWQAFYREVRQRRQALSEQTYWEMLGLEEGADHQSVVDAFDRLSRRYHPDRYTQHRSEAWGQKLHTQVSALYIALTEAYEVLSDRQLRKRYRDARREGRRRLPPDVLSSPTQQVPTSLSDAAQTSKGRRFLQMAQSELADDDYEDALQHLKFAQSVEPDNPHIDQKVEEVERHLEQRED